MEPDIFDIHIPETIREQEPKGNTKAATQDSVRVTINVIPGGPIAGTIASAGPLILEAPHSQQE